MECGQILLFLHAEYPQPGRIRGGELPGWRLKYHESIVGIFKSPLNFSSLACKASSALALGDISRTPITE